jgi:hypothetical protein
MSQSTISPELAAKIQASQQTVTREPDGQGPAIKAGEFILGYPDETGNLPSMPQPEILGRNGTYLGFRKLYSRVAAFRQYLRANAQSQEDEEWLKAKIVGRWPSGARSSCLPNETTRRRCPTQQRLSVLR